MSCIYRIYCSQCNKDAKSKMSWSKYIYYMSWDSKTKGYHNIEASLWSDEPTTCPKEHKIDVERTKVMINSDNNLNKTK